MVRRLLICSALLLAACSNDPVDKTPNGSPNNENNANNTTGSNNTTSNNTTGSNNTTSNNTTSNNCLNAAIAEECPPYFTLVDACPAGQECETFSTCGVEVTCLRETDPVTYRDHVCANDPDCDETAFGCEVDEDCALVKSGDYCGCLECPASAIENVNREPYLAYQQEARQTCESVAECGDAPCIEYVAHCNLETSQCEGRQAKYVTTQGLADGCEVASDCAPVFEGEVCDACMCPNEAIPAELVEVYRSAFDVECAHGVACDCPAYEVQCNEGTCELASP